MEINHLNNKVVKIENYQSTFLLLKVDNNLFRFDFVNKKEFSLETGEQNILEYFEKHPLLIDYSENLITTFINSKPNNPEIFVKDIENAINEITLGWRSWKNYITENNFFTFETFKKNIAEGSGKLSYAPFSISQNILNVCNKHNVSITAFDNELKSENFKLIIIGKSYLIAKDFKFYEQ